MAIKSRVVLHRQAFRNLRNSTGVLLDLDRRGRRIAAAAQKNSGDYLVDTQNGKNRARTGVIAQNWQTKKRNRDEHELLRALDAGR